MSQSHTDTSTEGASPDMITLHFHGIIESKFKYDWRKAQLYVRFKDPSLGGYFGSIKPQQQLQKVRTLADGSCLMATRIDIPVYKLRRLLGKLVYKYCLVRTQDTKWEAVKDGGDREQMITCSEIYLPTRFLHIHDSIMMGRFSFWKLPTTSQYKTEILLALKEMMPSWNGLNPIQSNRRCVPAEEVIKHIRNLEREMTTWSIWAFVNDNEKNYFKQALEEHFEFWLNNLNQPYWNGYEFKWLASLRMVSVMCMFVLMDEYEITMSKEDNHKMMKALQIQPEQQRNVYEDFIRSLKIEFSETTTRKLPDHIKNVINRGLSADKCDFAWLNCVPLLHFLEETNKPYEIPEVIYDENHRTPEWWGMQRKGMKDIVELSKRNFKIPEPKQLVMGGLESLFEVDWLLPRTILASLSHEHILNVLRWDKMPPEAVLAMVFYHLDQGTPNRQDILKDLPVFIKKSHGFYRGKCFEHQAKMSSLMRIISMDILRTITERHPDDNFIIPMMEAVLEVIQTEKLFNENVGRIDLHLQERVSDWFRRWKPGDGTIGKFEVLGRLLELTFPDSQETWTDTVVYLLKELIIRMDYDEIFWIFGQDASQKLKHKKLIDVFNKVAFMAAEQVLKSYRWFSKFGSERTPDVLKVFSTIFMNHWPMEYGHQPTTDPSKILQHILTDQNIRQFLEFFSKGGNRKSRLTEECQNCLTTSMALLTTIRESLISGDIRLSQLREILQYQEAFISLVPLVMMQPMSKEVMLKVIQGRGKQLDGLTDYKQHTKDLHDICLRVGGVDDSNLKNQVAVWSENDPKINDCSYPVRFDCESNEFVKDPLRNVFHISSDEIKTLQSLLKLKDCILFQHILRKACEEHLEVEPDSTARQERKVPVHDFLHVVVPKSETTWHDFCKQMRDGSVTLEATIAYFGDMQMGKVEKELSFIFNRKDDPDCQFCLQQIDGYRTLLQCKDSMDIVIEARKTLRLDGDFEVLDEMLKLTKSSELKCFTEAVVQAIGRLECLSKDDIDCIKGFLGCKELVDWLKDNFQGLEELKTLVDLALISAEGQGDLEVTKVSCLHTAVSGFAPLIYDLGPSSGFEQFLETYQDVTGALKADSKLPEMLRNLNDDLPWLKDMKDSGWGISTINDREIGAAEQSFQAHEDTISETPYDEPEGTGLGLKDLKDLQSRLILATGKESEVCFKASVSLLHDIVEILASGHIQIDQLELFLEYHGKVFDNVEGIKPWPPSLPSRQKLIELVKQREIELQQILKHKEFAVHLLALFKDIDSVISVDVTHLKKNLDEMKPESRMSSLCNTAVCDLRTMNICKQSQVETIFKFSAIDESKLTMFLRLGKSKILQSILIDINEKRPPGQRLTVLEFFQETWSQAEKVWSTLSKEMQDGSMTMMHIDSYFSYWKQNSSHLKREISFMFPDEQDGRIEERLRQIKCYWILLDHEPHIRLVCELKKILQLKGDFNLLDEIIFATKPSAELKFLDKKIAEVCTELTCSIQAHSDCVKAFIRCQPLVHWLREDFKDLMELQQYVERHGEADSERVSATVASFAPLIFNLPTTAGWEELSKVCQDVFSTFHRDTNLPSEWEWLNLNWFKLMKEAKRDNPSKGFTGQQYSMAKEVAISKQTETLVKEPSKRICNLEPERGEPHPDESLRKEKLAVLIEAAANGIYLKLRLVKCPGLWAQLLHLKVVSEEKMEEIQLNGLNSNSDQVAKLMEHIRRGTYKRYYNFCRALIKDDQAHIVSEFFKEDISSFKGVTCTGNQGESVLVLREKCLIL